MYNTPQKLDKFKVRSGFGLRHAISIRFSLKMAILLRLSVNYL